MTTANWPTNMPHSLTYPPVGADVLLASAARDYPHRIALRDGDIELTFADLNDAARRVASGLRQRGVMEGDVVALHMPNSVWFLVAYYGALCAGAAVAPVNPSQPLMALRRQLDDVRAVAVFSTRSGAAAVVEAEAASVRFVATIAPTAAAPADADPPAGTVPLEELMAAEPLTGYRVHPEAVAHLQPTGGTTGVSKSVRILHRNLVANVLQVGCWRAGTLPVLDADELVALESVPGSRNAHTILPGEGIVLSVAPLFHGLGLVSQNVSTLLGVTTTVLGRFDPSAMLARIEELGVTQISGSPAMYYALLRSPDLQLRDLSSVVLIGSGAAPLDGTALDELRRAFPRAHVSEGYGLSEATMGLTSVPANAQAPVGTVGRPLFDTEIEIRGLDAGEVLKHGETGEIWARGPQISAGYLDHPELTAKQFIDGWLATGDIGKLDEAGYLSIVGRAKDMIIYKGYNVYPQPLEELLCTHPDVAQAAVVGAPDAESGEFPIAFVQLKPDVTATPQFANELIELVASQVAPYQKVRAVHFVDALPITPTGKVLKTELRDRLARSL